MKNIKYFIPIFILCLITFIGCSNKKYVTLEGADEAYIGDSITLTLSDNTISDITWESSNEELARVTDGVVSCLSSGIVTITAYYNDTSSYHNITISEAPLIPYITIEAIDTLTEGESTAVIYACYNFSEQPEITITSSDTSIVSVKDNTLTAVKEGSADITVQAGTVSATMTVSVIPAPAFSIKGSTEIYTGKTWSYKVSGNVVTSWTLSDNTNAVVSNKGVITVYTTEAQDLTLYASLVTGETISLHINILDKVPEYDDSNLYVSSYLEGSTLRDSVVYNGTTYYYGYNAFYTLSQALTKAKENTTIYVGKGDYDMTDNAGDLSFSASHITLIGPNADKSATDKRESEANIYQNVRIASKITDITFNGLNFTRNTYITCYSLNDNITFTSCLFDGSTRTPNILPNQTYAGGCIRYFYSSSNTSYGLLINNCIFTNSKEVPIVLGNVTNVVIKDNLFDSLSTDAILVNPNTFNTSHTVTIQNNTFKNIANRAIALSQWGMASENDKDSYYIYQNTFDTVGTSGTAVIDLERYASGAASMMILGNTFKNNAYDIKASFTLGENDIDLGLTCNYNIFLGEPDQYYINSTLDATQLSMAYNAYYDLDGQKGLLTNISTKGADTVNALAKDKILATPLVSYNALILESEAGLTIKGVDSLSTTNTSIISITGTTLKPVSLGLAEVKYTKDGQEGSMFIFVKKYLGVDYIKAFVEMALSQEGYEEGNDNDTKYGDWYGLPHQAWCAMFVSWCANEAGIRTSIIPHYSLVADFMSWYQNAGRFGLKGSYTPTCGDLIIFKSDGASHIGIVTYCDGTTVYTIEGNTSNGCHQRKYALTYSKITGYGRPNYPTYYGKKYVFYPAGVTPGAGQDTI